MPVILQCLDPITKEIISLDKATGGLDYGTIRKAQQQTLSFILKNVGDVPATGCYIKGATLDDSTEVPPDEYNRQLLAASWKTFSLLPTRNFVPQLWLPTIPPGQMMTGQKEIVYDFSDPLNPLGWRPYTPVVGGPQTHSWLWTGDKLQVKPSPDTQTSYYARAEAESWGTHKEVDFTVNISMPGNATYGATFFMITLRAQASDGKGYTINMKRSLTHVYFEIRKCAGITNAGGNDFGIALVNSAPTPVPFVDYAPIRVKLWTNDSGLPEIRLWYNQISDIDTPILWGSTNPKPDSWVDVDNTFPNAGGIHCVCGTGMGGSFYFDNASLLGQDPEGKIYVRSAIGDGAEDSITYRSSAEIFYD